jgi:xanthine dehydrogenase accessory factor
MPVVAPVHSASLYQLLQLYAQSAEQQHWFAATVVTKYKSSYRKPGAMMLVNHLGQGFGLISGGCLEANICLQARKVESFGRAAHIIYDSTDEDNIAAELGLGCHGSVGILIQQLGDSHRSLLLQLLQRMQTGQTSYLLNCYSSAKAADLNALALYDQQGQLLASATDTALPEWPDQDGGRHQLIASGEQQWSLCRHLPPVNLWLVGGGVDAVPVASMAALLGWRVTVLDHRASNARQQDFPQVERVIRQPPDQFQEPVSADAVIIMSHNVDLDAAWLNQLRGASQLQYIGLLGPVYRKAEVFALAGIEADDPLAARVYGPMGFDIGGDLPASVALSVLSQCHQVLAGGQLL